MASREADLTDLNVVELRYLRKAVRYRLGKRDTAPSGVNTSVVSVERRSELDAIADWFVQDPA
jgi:hypothetical protein